MLTQSPGDGAAQARKEPLQDDAAVEGAPSLDTRVQDVPSAEEWAQTDAIPAALTPETPPNTHAETVPADAAGADVDAAPHAAIIPFPLAKADTAPKPPSEPEPVIEPAPETAPETAPRPATIQTEIAQHLRAGDRLAQARVRAGLTLEAASEKLRIRRDYLAALEDMNLKLLPGKAYAIPYLRSYARLLHLDAEAIVSQFQTESALSREDVTPQIRNPESKPQRERPWIWAVALVLVAAGFVAYRAVAPTSEGQPQTAGAPSSVNAGAEKSATRPVAPSVQGDGLPFGVAAQRLELRASAPAWLEVRTPNGTVMFSQDLAAGQVYQPDTGAGWTLHARDGGTFEVFVNGVSVGLLGEAGAPVLGRPVDAIAAAAMPPEPVASAAPAQLPPPPAAAPPVAGPPANVGAYAPVYAPSGAGSAAPPVQALPPVVGLGAVQVAPPPRVARPPQQRAQPRSQGQSKAASGAPDAPSSARTADSWETGEVPANAPPAASSPPNSAPSAPPTPAPSAAEPPPG